MGATGPVFVDELMAKDSVEEVMIQMNASHQVASQAPTDQKEKHAKLHMLLKSAKLIRPQEECRIKKRKLTESDEDKTIKSKQDDNYMNLKQAAKTGRVRFKD